MNLLLPVSTQRVAAAQAEDQDNGLAHKKRKLLNQFQGNLEANQKTESKTLKEVHYSLYSLIFIVIAQKKKLDKKNKKRERTKKKEPVAAVQEEDDSDSAQDPLQLVLQNS